MAKPKHQSESRTEDLVMDLLAIQGWKTARPPKGQVIRKNEYKDFPHIAGLFSGCSKTGSGDGYPDFLLLDSPDGKPVLIIEAKADKAQIALANHEAREYANGSIASGTPVLAAGVAGQENKSFAVGVAKATGAKWKDITYNGEPISWIPTPDDVARVLRSSVIDLRPIVPEARVLADRADLMNRILREASIKDEYRPAYIGAMMLALWQTKGRIRKESEYVLSDINKACSDAFTKAKKPELAHSIRIDEKNDKMAATAWIILSTLEKLNVVTAIYDHDYLGHLYESFFRYTGGNTIGQYFTPRHICRFMADICEVQKSDVIIDPSCGTGGFLIASIQRCCDEEKIKYEDIVDIIKNNLKGFESEPLTASLCVANMILRGDGKSGIVGEDCFKSKKFPKNKCDVALLNPPFPHEKTDTPSTDFIDRALVALNNGGRLAAILPTSIVVKREFAEWRTSILKDNTLSAVCELPDEEFQPFAAATTCVVVLKKGVKHNRKNKTVFVRVENDGLELKKGVRVPRRDGKSQLSLAIDAMLNKKTIPGFSGCVEIGDPDEWAPGAHIPSSEPKEQTVKESVDELMRRWLSFYAMYAPQITRLRSLVKSEELTPLPYRDMLSSRRIENAVVSSGRGVIGVGFDIFYGQKELHSRDGLPPGDTLIISPTEKYNGTYGWHTYSRVIKPPFVTIAQTGSIGEAFVQTETCGVNDDCLLLLPKVAGACDESTMAHLFACAAYLRLERWRFSYGRKLTPDRIRQFPFSPSAALLEWIKAKYVEMKKSADALLLNYQSVE